MAAGNKPRRNAFLMGGLLLVFGIIQLGVAYTGYKRHEMIPAGEGHELMTPTQGFIIAVIAFAFSGYAFAHAILQSDDRE